MMLILKFFESEEAAPTVHRVVKGPCTIGRTNLNSIEIDDPRISAEHARIVHRGDVWVLEDMHSANGVFANGEKVSELIIDREMSFFLGPIRVQALVYDPVPSDVSDKTHEIHVPIEHIRRKGVGAVARHLLTILGLLAVSFFAFFSEVPDQEVMTDLIIPFVTLVLVVYCTAGFASIFSKIHSKRYRFSRFLMPIAFWLASMSVLTILEDTFYFNLNSPILTEGLALIYRYVVTLVVAYFCFRAWLPEADKRKLFRRIALSVFALFFLYEGAMKIHEHDSDGYDNYGSIGYPILPISARGGPMKELEKQLEASTAHIGKLRKEALEDVDNDSGDDEEESEDADDAGDEP